MKEDPQVERLAVMLSALQEANQLRASQSRADQEVGVLPPRRIRPMALVSAQLRVNPFEFFILCSMVVVGFSYTVLRVPAPVSIRMLLPSLATIVWAANLLGGAVLALSGGLWWRNVEGGLVLYQLGWLLCGLACGVYGSALLILYGLVGFGPAMSYVGVALACVVRVLQVQRLFYLTRKAQRSGTVGPP